MAIHLRYTGYIHMSCISPSCMRDNDDTMTWFEHHQYVGKDVAYVWLRSVGSTIDAIR
jgi:hypothetical protein